MKKLAVYTLALVAGFMFGSAIPDPVAAYTVKRSPRECLVAPTPVVDRGPRTCEEIIEAFSDAEIALAPILPHRGAERETFWKKVVLRVHYQRTWTDSVMGAVRGLTNQVNDSAYYVQVDRDLNSLCHELGHVVHDEHENFNLLEALHIGWDDAPYGVGYLCQGYEAKWWLVGLKRRGK